MSNQLRVCRKVRNMLLQMLPRQKRGHIATLAMMITGIVMGKKAQLSAMST